jgi:hypothetical protein
MHSSHLPDRALGIGRNVGMAGWLRSAELKYDRIIKFNALCQKLTFGDHQYGVGMAFNIPFSGDQQISSSYRQRIHRHAYAIY